MRRLGFAMMMVISLVSLLAVTSLGLVRYFTTHLGLLSRQEQKLQARAAARGGLARALDCLARQSDWRGDWPDVQQPLSLSSYSLTFQPQTGLPYSLNNATGSSCQPGWGGRLVAPGTAYLVASGRSGGVQVRECALVSLPSLLFEDQFNSYSGAWVQSDDNRPVLLLGKYVLDLGALVQMAAQAGDPSWSDYRFQVRALVTGGTGLGLLVRAQEDDHRPSGYLVQYSALDGALEGGSFRVFKMVNGVPGPAQARVTRQQAGLGGLLGLQWLLNLEHTYEVTVQDNRLSLRVDQQHILTWTDSERTFRRGRVGIHPLLGAVLLVDSARVDGLFQVRTRWSEPQ